MSRSSDNFWYGKNVLITGGDGFVASNLAAALIGRNANVVVTVRHQRPVSTLKLLGLSDVVPDVEFSDLSDFLSVQKLCNRHQIDTIFHLANIANDPSVDLNPYASWEVNVLAGMRLIDRAARHGVNCVQYQIGYRLVQ